MFLFGLEIAPARAVFTLKFDYAKNEIQFIASHTEWCYNSNGHDEKWFYNQNHSQEVTKEDKKVIFINFSIASLVGSVVVI